MNPSKNFTKIFSFFQLLTLMFPSSAKAQAQQGQYANVNGIKMYYEIQGSGMPLVLIHGGGSTLQTTFGTIMPILSKTHRVIAVELQSHGHTSNRQAPESFEQDADDVAELLRQLNITGADLFGFSNGGNTAMQVAIRHPERVRKLVIASSFYKRDGMPAEFWKGMNAAALDNMPQVYKDAYLNIPGNNEAGLETMFLNDARRMQTFKDWKDEDLQSIKAPALVVMGNHDVATPEHAVAMHRLIGNSQLLIVPGNHGSYMGEVMTAAAGSRAPEHFVALVEDFLTAKIN